MLSKKISEDFLENAEMWAYWDGDVKGQTRQQEIIFQISLTPHNRNWEKHLPVLRVTSQTSCCFSEGS